MYRKSSFKFAIFLTAVLLVGISERSGAQATDPTGVCGKYQLSDQRCSLLTDEFYSNHLLMTGDSVPTLDLPSASLRAFASEIGPKAFLSTLKSGLNTDAVDAAQAALQTVSTSAATTQSGGSPTVSGSTNLVTKPTTTDLISMAAESGAFTDTINGTTATLQANALGLTKYISNRPVFQRWASSYADRIQPLNFTVTLNVAQSSSSAAATTGAANSATPASIASILLPSNNASLSSFGVAYNVYRRYSPQNKTFLDRWSKAVTANMKQLGTANQTLKADIDLLIPPATIPAVAENMNAAMEAWHVAGRKAETAANPNFDDFVNAYMSYDQAFCNFVLSTPNSAQNALRLAKDIQSFQDAVYTVVNQARGTPLATIAYTYSTPVQKPSTHDATASFSYLFKSGTQLTGNFAASVYANVPTGAAYGRLRDIQVSGELDKPFGGTAAAPRGTFSVAGYDQYQSDPTVLNITAGNLVPGTNITLPNNAQVLLGTAGWLGVVQGKVVFNLKGGLTIPVAVKWSNKTDLLQGSDTRGQIGVSYDLSALSSLVTGQK